MSKFSLLTSHPSEATSQTGFQLLDWKMRLTRSRKESGAPYGPVMAQEVELTVKYINGANVLYERLNDNELHNFYVSDLNGILFQLEAYVVDIDESYDIDENNTYQILAKITLLAAKITYTGTSSSLEATLV